MVADAIDSLVPSFAEPKTDIHLMPQRQGADGLLTVQHPLYERNLVGGGYDDERTVGRTRFYTAIGLD